MISSKWENCSFGNYDADHFCELSMHRKVVTQCLTCVTTFNAPKSKEDIETQLGSITHIKVVQLRGILDPPVCLSVCLSVILISKNSRSNLILMALLPSFSLPRAQSMTFDRFN